MSTAFSSFLFHVYDDELSKILWLLTQLGEGFNPSHSGSNLVISTNKLPSILKSLLNIIYSLSECLVPRSDKNDYDGEDLKHYAENYWKIYEDLFLVSVAYDPAQRFSCLSNEESNILLMIKDL